MKERRGRATFTFSSLRWLEDHPSNLLDFFQDQVRREFVGLKRKDTDCDECLCRLVITASVSSTRGRC